MSASAASQSEQKKNDCSEVDRKQPQNDHVTNFNPVNGCNPLQLDFMRRCAAVKKYTIMVSGKSRMGKSTALNNILGLKLPARVSPVSVTKQVIMESTTSQDGMHVCGIDTPGLRATDIDPSKILKDMGKMVGIDVENFTFLYCLSVEKIKDLEVLDDFEIMKSLTKQFGPDIWKRCTLVLTYCDSARKEHFKSEGRDEDYKKYLQDFANIFRDTLKKSISDALNEKTPDVKVPAVKVILDLEVIESDSSRMTKVEIPHDTIVAVPAAISRKEGRELKILPGFNIGGNIDWTEYAFFEIIRRSGRFTPSEIEEIKEEYSLAVDVMNGVITTGVGVSVGAFIGLAGGPPGVALGALIGAGVGGVVGSLTRYIFVKGASSGKKQITT